MRAGAGGGSRAGDRCRARRPWRAGGRSRRRLRRSAALWCARNGAAGSRGGAAGAPEELCAAAGLTGLCLPHSAPLSSTRRRDANAGAQTPRPALSGIGSRRRPGTSAARIPGHAVARLMPRPGRGRRTQPSSGALHPAPHSALGAAFQHPAPPMPEPSPQDRRPVVGQQRRPGTSAARPSARREIAANLGAAISLRPPRIPGRRACRAPGRRGRIRARNRQHSAPHSSTRRRFPALGAALCRSPVRETGAESPESAPSASSSAGGTRRSASPTRPR